MGGLLGVAGVAEVARATGRAETLTSLPTMAEAATATLKTSTLIIVGSVGGRRERLNWSKPAAEAQA